MDLGGTAMKICLKKKKPDAIKYVAYTRLHHNSRMGPIILFSSLIVGKLNDWRD